MRYREKPILIDAFQATAEVMVACEFPIWFTEALNADEVVIGVADPMDVDGLEHLTFTIRTLEGEMVISPGDWVIRGVRGELYPCKPDIFEATYDPEEDV